MTTSQVTVAARLAAKLLAHRQTPQNEVADLIRFVHEALDGLEQPAEAAAPAEAPAAKGKVGRPRRQAKRQEEPLPAESEPPVPAAPKLVRRADVASPATPPAFALAAPASSTLRGVVRWFDPKSGKGAVRLPGLGDVGFEARVLAESGITRLFKGQEIEATLEGGNGTAQLQRLTLPGVVTGSPLGAGGTVRSRHAKPVLVELKREALKRAAARAEAELVLGPNRTR